MTNLDDFFDEIRPEPPDDEEEPQKYDIDIFKEVIPRLDKKNFKFFDELDEDQKKAINDGTLLVMLQSMSSVQSKDRDLCEYSILVANMLNKNFWDVNPFFKENYGPEELARFQLRVLSIIGMGKRLYHPWLGFKKPKKDKLDELLHIHCPYANREELELFLSMNTREDIIGLAKDYGWQDDKIQELEKEIKK